MWGCKAVFQHSVHIAGNSVSCVFGLHVLLLLWLLVLFDEKYSFQSLILTFLCYFMIYEAIWGLPRNTALIYNTVSMKNKL